MTEACEGLRALGGKLNHLGLEKAPAKSTASDGLRNRDNIIFSNPDFSRLIVIYFICYKYKLEYSRFNIMAYYSICK